MRALIDTSSLLKKYVLEKGTKDFNAILNNISEIILAPVTILEVHSALERRLQENTIEPDDAKWIEKEFNFDYNFFGIVPWNEELMDESIKVIRKHHLKTLDGIQLSAGIKAEVSIFITSDKRLYAAAKKELPDAALI